MSVSPEHASGECGDSGKSCESVWSDKSSVCGYIGESCEYDLSLIRWLYKSDGFCESGESDESGKWGTQSISFSLWSSCVDCPICGLAQVWTAPAILVSNTSAHTIVPNPLPFFLPSSSFVFIHWWSFILITWWSFILISQWSDDLMWSDRDHWISWWSY